MDISHTGIEGQIFLEFSSQDEADSMRRFLCPASWVLVRADENGRVMALWNRTGLFFRRLQRAKT